MKRNNPTRSHHHHHHSASEENFQDIDVFKRKVQRLKKIRKIFSKVFFYLLILIAVLLLTFCIYAANDDTVSNRNEHENFMKL
jgi:hypothetical protein